MYSSYRLLNLIKPKNLYLGEKDWQQLLILKNLVLKKKLNVAIKSIPTQRDFDGIPLSSRNVHSVSYTHLTLPTIYSV